MVRLQLEIDLNNGRFFICDKHGELLARYNLPRDFHMGRSGTLYLAHLAEQIISTAKEQAGDEPNGRG